MFVNTDKRGTENAVGGKQDGLQSDTLNDYIYEVARYYRIHIMYDMLKS
jgi:hypothetical protein